MIDVRRVDLRRASVADDTATLIDAYARDPMGLGRPLDPAARRRLVDVLRGCPGCIVFHARLRDRLVGGAVCFLQVSTFCAGPALHLHDLIVVPDCRRNGVGGAMLAHIERWATEQGGCCRLSLDVRLDNAAARRLYTRRGFEPGRPPYEHWTRRCGGDR